MNIPVMAVDAYDLNNFVSFICVHEDKLTEYGAIKLTTTGNCELALKKRKISHASVLVQRAKQAHQNELIYTIYKRGRSNSKGVFKASPITDEQTFWSTLSHSNTKPFQSDVIISPNTSLFYEKWNRRYFTTYQIPRQSLLTLGSNTLVHECVPTLAEGYGPGAIFPLAVAPYGLPLLIYHHGGGDRHWYIIRGQHREALIKLMTQCKGAECIEHDALFVDPSVFDRNQIPYHHIVQHPHELLVLDAGTIAQSFTTDVHWSESIPFGLPSWIRNGHAHAYQSFCRCDTQDSIPSDPINLHMFTEERISQYVTMQIDAYYKLRPLPLTTISPIVQLNSLPSLADASSQELTYSSDGHHPSTHQEAEYHSTRTHTDDQYKLDEILEYLTRQETSIMDTMDSADQNCFDEYVLTPFINIDHLPQFHDSNLPSISGYNEGNSDTYARSPNNYCPMDPESDSSVVEISHESSNQSTTLFQTTNNAPTSNQKTSFSSENLGENDRPTALFVSGLKYNVTKVDLYKHFLGSIKITVKSCPTVPHLKCAFIEHRTSQQAKRNLKRRIDHKLLGRECFIQYACIDHSSSSVSSYRVLNERTIAVTKIPEHVTKYELHSVFENGVIMRYCPVKILSRRGKARSNSESSKLESGFALVVFHTDEEAVDVIRNAHQYRIHEQALDLSVMSET